MRLLLLALVAALIAVQGPRPAAAQPQMSFPLTYLDLEPDQLVAAAFSAPYGQLLIAEFAAVLAESAEANCLKTNGIETSSLPDRARAIMLRQGAEFARKLTAMVDRDAFKATYVARMGAGAETELAKVREHPDVREFLELAAVARDAAIASGIAEMIDRNIVVLKIKMARRFHPLATGNQKLIEADPSDSINDKLDDLVTRSKSAALARYVELTDAMQEAVDQNINAQSLLGVSNVDLMPGLDKDLAVVCVHRN